MSDYTPALVRSLVDDLDAVLRKAVEDGNLKEALKTERGRLVNNFIFTTKKH
jgi:hypothetical protein